MSDDEPPTEEEIDAEVRAQVERFDEEQLDRQVRAGMLGMFFSVDELDDGQWSATDEITKMYGVGHDRYTALEDLEDALLDLCAQLERNPSLTTQQASVLDHIRGLPLRG